MEQHGGKRYGEGVKGYVEDNECIKHDTATFCHYLQSSSIETFTLYGLNRHFLITDTNEIESIKKRLYAKNKLTR